MKKVLFTSFALCAGIALTFAQANASGQSTADSVANQQPVTLTAQQPQTAISGLERFRDFIQRDHDNG